MAVVGSVMLVAVGHRFASALAQAIATAATLAFVSPGAANLCLFYPFTLVFFSLGNPFLCGKNEAGEGKKIVAEAKSADFCNRNKRSGVGIGKALVGGKYR